MLLFVDRLKRALSEDLPGQHLDSDDPIHSQLNTTPPTTAACVACGGTGLDSRGGDCSSCLVRRRRELSPKRRLGIPERNIVPNSSEFDPNAGTQLHENRRQDHPLNLDQDDDDLLSPDDTLDNDTTTDNTWAHQEPGNDFPEPNDSFRAGHDADPQLDLLYGKQDDINTATLAAAGQKEEHKPERSRKTHRSMQRRPGTAGVGESRLDNRINKILAEQRLI